MIVCLKSFCKLLSLIFITHETNSNGVIIVCNQTECHSTGNIAQTYHRVSGNTFTLKCPCSQGRYSACAHSGNPIAIHNGQKPSRLSIIKCNITFQRRYLPFNTAHQLKPKVFLSVQQRKKARH